MGFRTWISSLRTRLTRPVVRSHRFSSDAFVAPGIPNPIPFPDSSVIAFKRWRIFSLAIATFHACLAGLFAASLIVVFTTPLSGFLPYTLLIYFAISVPIIYFFVAGESDDKLSGDMFFFLASTFLPRTLSAI